MCVKGSLTTKSGSPCLGHGIRKACLRGAVRDGKVFNLDICLADMKQVTIKPPISPKSP